MKILMKKKNVQLHQKHVHERFENSISKKEKKLIFFIESRTSKYWKHRVYHRRQSPVVSLHRNIQFSQRNPQIHHTFQNRHSLQIHRKKHPILNESALLLNIPFRLFLIT
mgnify:CR=1 FL=1